MSKSKSAKDAYWFSHDSNAKDDPKCMVLMDQLGLEGYGIYWILVETLRDQPGYKYPLKLLPVLAKRYFTSAEKFKAVVLNYDLFKIYCDEFFFSESLNERMQVLEGMREQRRLAANARWDKERGKDADAMRSHSECNATDMLSTVQYSKGKDSIVKDSKEDKPRNEIPEDYYLMAEVFHKAQLKNNPEVMTGVKENFKGGADAVDKLIRLDGFTLEKIKNALNFAVKDDFWGKQVRSLAGLRERKKNGQTKFQNLYASMVSNSGRSKMSNIMNTYQKISFDE